MAISIIPKQASEPEFITQDIYAFGSKSGSNVTFASKIGINSGTLMASASFNGYVFDISISGYKAVGIERTAAYAAPSSASDSDVYPVGKTDRSFLAIDSDGKLTFEIPQQLFYSVNTFKLGSNTRPIKVKYIKI